MYSQIFELSSIIYIIDDIIQYKSRWDAATALIDRYAIDISILVFVTMEMENFSWRCNIVRFKIGSARFAMQQITFIASGAQSGNPMSGESLIRKTNVITYFCRQVINNVSIWPFTNFSAFGWAPHSRYPPRLLRARFVLFSAFERKGSPCRMFIFPPANDYGAAARLEARIIFR